MRSPRNTVADLPPSQRTGTDARIDRGGNADASDREAEAREEQRKHAPAQSKVQVVDEAGMRCREQVAVLERGAPKTGASGSNRQAESTYAPERGGLLRSSVEAGVTPVERRGRVAAIGSGQPATGRTR